MFFKKKYFIIKKLILLLDYLLDCIKLIKSDIYNVKCFILKFNKESWQTIYQDFHKKY